MNYMEKQNVHDTVSMARKTSVRNNRTINIGTYPTLPLAKDAREQAELLYWEK